MAIGDPYPLAGQTKVSDAESREHQATLLAKRIMDVPSDLQILCDYDVRTDGQPVYVGFSPKGLAEATDGWLIYKLTYDSDNNITSRKTQFTNWTDRTSGTYE